MGITLERETIVGRSIQAPPFHPEGSGSKPVTSNQQDKSDRKSSESSTGASMITLPVHYDSIPKDLRIIPGPGISPSKTGFDRRVRIDQTFSPSKRGHNSSQNITVHGSERYDALQRNVNQENSPMNGLAGVPPISNNVVNYSVPVYTSSGANSVVYYSEPVIRGTAADLLSLKVQTSQINPQTSKIAVQNERGLDHNSISLKPTQTKSLYDLNDRDRRPSIGLSEYGSHANFSKFESEKAIMASSVMTNVAKEPFLPNLSLDVQNISRVCSP